VDDDDEDDDDDSIDVGRADLGVALQDKNPKCSRSCKRRRKIFAQYL